MITGLSHNLLPQSDLTEGTIFSYDADQVPGIPHGGTAIAIIMRTRFPEVGFPALDKGIAVLNHAPANSQCSAHGYWLHPDDNVIDGALDGDIRREWLMGDVFTITPGLFP